MPTACPWIPHVTADGSYTFYSTEFGETFHSNQGAKAEAFEKFVMATQLLRVAAETGTVRILDVCYGLGYNTAAALTAIEAAVPGTRVEVMALELDGTVPQGALQGACLESWPPSVQTALVALAQAHQYGDDRHQLQLHLGDARQTLPTIVAQGWQADAIFLDPFSPRRCPQLWTVEFLAWVARTLSPQGILATYCRAAAVRSALQSAGLGLGTLPLAHPKAPHHWAEGTIASREAAVLTPLSPLEQEHLQTRAAIPYRDPTLTDTAPLILQRRQQEQQRSTRESTTQWRKRWGIEANC
ncbi:MAG: tRNA (5-methylaminomethyl-2-thiouridine)(34)-methyltransferase MnmD [Prochlorothrix sp.]|nr:MnmC family methyltransferase [Prochlorothrix sp.]